jgi:hypothetical protein
MENLEWFAVPYNGLETNIEVTKCGKVRRVKINWSYQIKLGNVNFSDLKLSTGGYRQITIQIKNNISRKCLLHQLIAATFLGYEFKGHKLVIDHIDSNKLNNNIDNLRIIKCRENCSKEKTIKSNLPTGVCWRKRESKFYSQISIFDFRFRLIYMPSA